jgi:uncharacterized membrane protein HdeD (DUF308 family)
VINDLFPVGGLIAGLVTIAAGVIILIWPKVLPYIISIYLIIVGLGTVIVALR